MGIKLFGFKYSVYSWIVRLALQEKGVAYEWSEVNPFAENVSEEYLALQPFKRVPTMDHDGFVLYETVAITRYVDEAFEGPPLQLNEAKLRARQSQIISIVDSYGYWPLVRQVFSHGFFRPLLGEKPDMNEMENGLLASAKVLNSLDRLLADGDFLLGDQLTLADIHLFPMINYFAKAEQGRDMLLGHEELASWHELMVQRPGVVASAPNFELQ